MTLYIGYKATYMTYYNYKMLPENVEHFFSPVLLMYNVAWMFKCFSGTYLRKLSSILKVWSLILKKVPH